MTARSRGQNSTAAMHVLSMLDTVGEDGLTREEIMTGLGLPWRIDWFNHILAHARRQAALLGRVIPRPTGYVESSTGYQRYAYRLTNLMGDVDGTNGARAGLLITLGDALSRQQTQAATLDVLKTSPALSTPARRKLVQAHASAVGQAAQLEILLDMVEAVP